MAKQNQEKAKQKSEQGLIRANINRQTIKAEQFMSVYANDTQLQLTPWDVRLIFGVIDEVATPGNATTTVKQLGEVRMSLQHAKKVTQILVSTLAQYEEMTKTEIAVPD